MTSSVVFTPEAEEQLVDLYRYIAAAGSPEAAARYTDSIVTILRGVGNVSLPGQGTRRHQAGASTHRLQATSGRRIRRYRARFVDCRRLLRRPRLRSDSGRTRGLTESPHRSLSSGQGLERRSDRRHSGIRRPTLPRWGLLLAGGVGASGIIPGGRKYRRQTSRTGPAKR